MKYLQDYMNDAQTKALNEAGAFFAFSKSQYDEQKKEGVIYVNGPAGMICPKENLAKLMDTLENIYKLAIEQDIAENGLERIVIRELNNHEAYYTTHLESTIEALTDYPVTPEDIKHIFHNKNYKIIK